MNFGKWIVVAFVSFALFIGILVTVCVRQDISLVSKNYYEQELDYQHQIERETNTDRLLEKPIIFVNQKQLVINFPYLEDIEDGQLKLFRPSDVRLDKTFTLQKVEDDQTQFNVNELPRGMYKAQMQWSMMGKEYYFEQIINI